MNTASKSIDRLKEAGFKEDQAQVLVTLLEKEEYTKGLNPVNEYYLNSQITGLKNEMIMWMVGLLIVFSSFLFVVLSQRITASETALNQRVDSLEASLNQRIDSLETSLNQRIDGLEKDIAENRVLIRKILDNQNKAR